MASATLRRRLANLEHVLAPKAGEKSRLLVYDEVGIPNLSTSKCTRHWGADGNLHENVEIDGCLDGLTQEGLERWIASFPIT